MNIHLAPVQGHTDAPYRAMHREIYGDTFQYSPFVRLENDGLRARDVKDITSPLNPEGLFTPQIIFRDADELDKLVAEMRRLGFNRIDLNMGCPFPLQTGHGRGAATIANPELVDKVVQTIDDNPDLEFSVKMRLGLNGPDEWVNLIDKLNTVNLKHITVHPRVAKQQYGGELDMEQFERILGVSRKPIVFNGDIKSPAQIAEVLNRYPAVGGIMIGRGLLGRPSMAAEYREGEEWSREKRIETMLGFHRRLLDRYASTLCGDAQLISKIKPFWEYAEDEIGRKAWKAIRKATNMAKYHSAVAMVGT